MNLFTCRKKRSSRHYEKFSCYGTNQFNKTVKIVRADNGTTFVCLKTHFEEKENLHQTSVVGTPQQNRCVECKQRNILNMVCT